MTLDAEALRVYVEALFAERDRATAVAASEREKAAEKLRVDLVRATNDGDARLREHIESQMSRLEADLISADKLETARDHAVLERIEAVSREVSIERAASEKAILKAEASTDKRFESVNEFRAQLSDQATRFMPREVGEARMAALEQWQSKIVGALILVTFVLPGVTAIAVYFLTHNSTP